MENETPKEKFLASLKDSNTDYGWVRSKLLGERNLDEDKDGVKNRDIDIFYLIRKANRPNAPYVIFFNGGPGIAFTDMYNKYGYDKFLPSYNIVFMDQRGNGLSSEPHNNLHELKYFTARYISYDAEKIRNRLLGEAGKWAVFGQSYGGIVVRKYIELYPEHVLVAFSHGSAKYNAIDVAVSTELNTSKRINDYFKKYPKDLELIQKINYQLKTSDVIASKVYKLSGKDIIDFLYIFFAINPDEKVHAFFESLDKDGLSASFLKGISPIAQVVLDAGKINSVISHIDLMDGATDKIISKEVRKRLSEKQYNVNDSIVSKVRLDENIEVVSNDHKELERLFGEDHYKSDPTNLSKIAKNLKQYPFNLHVFGSTHDTLAIDSVRSEEKIMKDIKASSCYYHYSNGTHREWLENKDIFVDILSSITQSP